MDANKYLTELVEMDKEWQKRLAILWEKAAAMTESLPEGDCKDEMRKIIDNSRRRRRREGE